MEYTESHRYYIERGDLDLDQWDLVAYHLQQHRPSLSTLVRGAQRITIMASAPIEDMDTIVKEAYDYAQWED